MLDPQENITIGNFLYSLGLGVGIRAGGNAPPAAVNLLQQTSYDGQFGDVMLTFPGVTRLLEFKREGNYRKEWGKVDVLNRTIAELPHRVSTSLAIHWCVETARADVDFNFEARPYLDMFDRRMPALGMKAFVDAVINDALSPPKTASISDRLVNEYINDVALTWLVDGERKLSSTGILVVVGSDLSLRYVVVEDLADLGRTRSELLRLQLDRGEKLRSAEPLRESQQARTRTPPRNERVKSRGLER